MVVRRHGHQKNITDHIKGCYGPSEKSYSNVPHNGLSLSDAIKKPDELILFHLNVEFGKRSKNHFNSSSQPNSQDVQWRKDNQSRHSYFSVSDLKTFANNLSKITDEGGKQALLRTRIAYEGKIYPLQKFIVRNNARDRLNIIEGENGKGGLKYRGELNERHSIKSPFGDNFVYGEPRLVVFEAAQTLEMARHPDGKNVVRGHRYKSSDGRTVFDQLHFNNSGLTPDQFIPNGGLILAIPFIHPKQNTNHPIVHWSIKSDQQVVFAPPKEVVKILCWDGQNIPQIPPKKPVQKTLNLS